jgi:transcriptional regulator with XRE-family HTH domain
MDYSLIEFAIAEKKITIKEMANACGMTPAGYVKMMKKGSMSVESLELISKRLSIPICYWWKDDAEMLALADQEKFLENLNLHYIHREAFMELKKQWKQEREMLLGQIKLLQNIVNQSIAGKVSNKVV